MVLQDMDQGVGIRFGKILAVLMVALAPALAVGEWADLETRQAERGRVLRLMAARRAPGGRRRRLSLPGLPWASGAAPVPRLQAASSYALDLGVRAIDRLQLREPLDQLLVRYAPRPILRYVKQRVTRAKVEHRAESQIDQVAYEASCLAALTYLRDKHGADALGDYLEFGVYTGSALICMHRALTALGLDRVRLFGFDSFDGFPDEARTDDEGFWTVGGCNADEAFARKCLTQAGADWGRTHLVKGWFRDTLTPELLAQQRINRVSVIMIDCDLYSSAKEALTFCAPLIRDEAVIFFDDMVEEMVRRNLGEQKAFTEFLAEHPEFEARDFGGYGPKSRGFVVTRRERSS